MGRSRCERHAATDATAAARFDRKRRGSSRSRGYDSVWQRVRGAHLARSPLCVECRASGWTVVAKDVDHIVPFKGITDPLRLDPSNLQSLCRAHHNRKTARQNDA